MQIPILNGIFTDENSDFRSKYPRNMVPVPKAQGISQGYLRQADGLIEFATGPGPDRGGIVWNGNHYRAMGSKLVSVDPQGVITELGILAGSTPVTLDYSFEDLIIAAGGNLYYFDGALTQVTDADLGTVIDAIYVDGYTMTTDGTSLIVNDLADKYAINPLKYGSSEADPDRVVALKKLRNEPCAINRYTCESFNNVGGTGFPFVRNEGAQLQRGAMGTHCVAVYMEAIAFLGGGRNEAPAVYLGVNGTTAKISTREIDTIIEGYTEAELAASEMEVRVFKNHELLYLHLPDQCLVYDGSAAATVQEPVWFTLDSGVIEPATYRGRHFVYANSKWICGDPTGSTLGEVTVSKSSHYGDVIGWDFGTSIIYNESHGAILHQLELVALPGRVIFGVNPVIWTSHSTDGETWSSEVTCNAGRQGERNKRLTWLQQGYMENWRIQRFRGTSDAFMSFARLEVAIEALYV